MDSKGPTPEGLSEYYRRSIEALERLAAQPATAFGLDSRFFAMTPREFEEALRAMRRELDHEVSLALMASAEASLRADYDKRVRGVRKIPRGIRDRFRALDDKYGRRVELRELVLAWRDECGRQPGVFNAFLDYLLLRHWLAHGRYWSKKTSREPEPFEVLACVTRLFALLPSDITTTL